MIDFWFGLACGMLINLLISWIAPGPLPRARQAAQDTHLYLHESASHMTIIRGFNQDKVRAVAVRVINGKPITFDQMTGPGHMFSVPQWKALRLQLQDRGYLELPPNSAPVVTEKGKIMFDQLARGER